MRAGGLALGCLCIAALAAPAHAQTAAARGDGWASIAQLPDFWTGVWEPIGAGPRGPRPERPVLTPAAEAKTKAFVAAQARGENVQSQSANCLPPALPQSMAQPYPIQFLPTPGKITIALEAYSQMRRIYMDGRAHPEDPLETFQGNSIGHWEGDTLVVDTAAVVNNYDIAPGTGHSPQMHLVERIHLVEPDRLEVQTTVTDPQVLAAPYSFSRNYVRHRDWDIQEYVCEQNNRDSADEKGRPGLKF